jgi:hypothetical protein
MKKRYTVKVTYVGEVDAESEEELEDKLWVFHKLFGEPYNKYWFEAEEVEIELEE